MPGTLVKGSLQLTRAAWELLDKLRDKENLSRGAYIECLLEKAGKVKLPDRPERGRYDRG